MCIWKAWKEVKSKVANLIRCGINKYKAYEWGNTRKGYWRIADSYILYRAITNEHLCRTGYATLMGRISNGIQNRNRRMPNGTYGGVRGRKTKVGRKLLRFPPTRLFICIFKPLQFVTYSLQDRICLPSWWTIMPLTDALLSEYIIFCKKFMKILHNA